jgi:hypothetical protein
MGEAGSSVDELAPREDVSRQLNANTASLQATDVRSVRKYEVSNRTTRRQKSWVVETLETNHGVIAPNSNFKSEPNPNMELTDPSFKSYPHGT